MPDPLGGASVDPQALNRYVYAKGDPINAWDPSGLSINQLDCVKVGDECVINGGYWDYASVTAIADPFREQVSVFSYDPQSAAAMWNRYIGETYFGIADFELRDGPLSS